MIQTETNKIYNEDCIAGMKKLPDNSVDAIVTDPPYELGFMGKKWDNSGIAYNIELWKEALRVLKPGGFLLSFGGTRTYHRMTCGIEDAGFEIRDCIMWLYGSGFPKSLNIGKQIDKLQGNEREFIGLNPNGFAPTKTGMIANEGGNKIAHPPMTKGDSEWEGWGTALKPACEPIVVARKPLSEKNVALNVLKWGTGGINIDGCRVEGEQLKPQASGKTSKAFNLNNQQREAGTGVLKDNDVSKKPEQGRFPANIILDEEAGKMLDLQSGFIPKSARPNVKGKKYDSILNANVYGKYNPTPIDLKHTDKGGASRFFYCAKASKGERNDGCEELEDSTTDDGREVVSDRHHQRGASQRKNNHPTVKPITLMQYLVKLVTPKEGLVLDPFMGSGTTAIACWKENKKFIGFEKSKEYWDIAQAKIKDYLDQTKLTDVM